MTNELLDKYLEGNCTQEEKETVQQWLRRQEVAEMDTILYSRWEQGNSGMPAADTYQLWQNLLQQLPAGAPVKSITAGKKAGVWVRRLSVAAAFLAVIVTAAVWFRHQQAAGSDAPLAVQQSANTGALAQWIYIQNDSLPHQKILLEDGSVAILERNAAIRYRKGFDRQQRRITLKGTAFFQVAADKQRPFSVYSGDIITTAIGTAFTVKYANDQSPVIVQLHEGKVKVHKATAAAGKTEKVVYLLPGQQCRYTVADRQMLVSTFRQSRIPAVTTNTTEELAEDITADTLLFNNRPLANVLQQLEKRYQTTILYNNKDIADSYFSGKVVKADSLQMVLRIIAQMNALQLSQENGIYRLSKQ